MDNKDKAILRELQKDADITVGELADGGPDQSLLVREVAPGQDPVRPCPVRSVVGHEPRLALPLQTAFSQSVPPVVVAPAVRLDRLPRGVEWIVRGGVGQIREERFAVGSIVPASSAHFVTRKCSACGMSL